MKFTKPFKGATAGSAYPTDFKPGDECPENLIVAAKAAGALEVEKPKAASKAKADKE